MELVVDVRRRSILELGLDDLAGVLAAQRRDDGRQRHELARLGAAPGALSSLMAQFAVAVGIFGAGKSGHGAGKYRRKADRPHPRRGR